MKKIMPLFLYAVVLILILSSCDLFVKEFDYPAGVRRALIVGVAEYIPSDPDHDLNLSYTDDDANDLNTFFSSKGFDTTLLLDSNATKTSIFTEIDTIAAAANENDITIFTFSGHGDGYYRSTPLSSLADPNVTSDDYPGDSALFPFADTFTAENAIFSTELLDKIATIPGKKVIILDICHAGGFVYDGYADVDGLSDDYGYNGDPSIITQMWDTYFSQEQMHDYNDIWVIASAGAHELAYESSSVDNGYFTYFLLQGLGYDHDTNTVPEEVQADANGDGYITVTEMYGEGFSLFETYYNNDPLRSASSKYYSHLSGGPYDLILFSNN